MMELILQTPIGFEYLSQNPKFSFILLHLLKNKKYKEYYLKQNTYRILDNSCYELGESLDSDILMKEAKELNVNEVIIPGCSTT